MSWRLSLSRLFPCLLLTAGAMLVYAQDRFPSMPGYAEYMEASRAYRNVRRPVLEGRWLTEDTYGFKKGDKDFVYDFATKKVTEANGGLDLTAIVEPRPWNLLPRGPFAPQAPQRGRQFAEASSPVGGYKAVYRDANVYLVQENGDEKPITTDGTTSGRIKYGIASWVYGEELNQRHAMGFSPDGKHLWFYRFDENPVKDYFLTLGLNAPHNTPYIEAYPKPGTDNPVVDLYLYEVASGKTTKVVSRPGEFDNGMGHYLYSPAWAADSSELFFYRMDRRQKHKEYCAAKPDGTVRVVDKESNPDGWIEFGPMHDVNASGGRRGDMPYVAERIMILSEDDGHMQLYWLNTKSGQRTKLTNQRGDVTRIVRMDTDKNRMFYMAADGDTPYRHQLHRVDLDGRNHKRLTDPKFHHTIAISDSGRLIDTYQTSEQSPRMRALDEDGKILEELADTAAPKVSEGFEAVQWFSFKTFDGTETLYGQIHKPRNFDPSKKYPIMVDVYGGPLPPGFGGASETFGYSSPQASTGFIQVSIRGRGENGRGRAFRQAIYRKLGIVEIDDQAAGVKALSQFPWADTSRVGINGVSYGGYASAMAILRYPDVFHAASSSSMVSSWKNYDTTYTERYMDLLEENEKGYAAGSPMTYADDLKGWLMLYYGTADDNTHPTNTYQFANALTRAGKFYELQVGVDAGHSGLGFARMMEFFIERLVVQGPRD